jgi:hypothetical protein
MCPSKLVGKDDRVETPKKEEWMIIKVKTHETKKIKTNS